MPKPIFVLNLAVSRFRFLSSSGLRRRYHHPSRAARLGTPERRYSTSTRAGSPARPPRWSAEMRGVTLDACSRRFQSNRPTLARASLRACLALLPGVQNAAWTLLGVWASACFAFFAFFAFFGSDDRLQVQHAVRLHVEIRKKAFVLMLLLVLARANAISSSLADQVG